MRTLSKVALTTASLVALLAAASSAGAAPMDPTPDRLYVEPSNLPAGVSCQSLARNPMPVNGATPNGYPCVPNNTAWANMMSEMGYAIAPTAFHPARTTGYGGFALSLEATYAKINPDARDNTGTQYWHQGTQGSLKPDGSFGTANNAPDSVLGIYSLKARKGLPLGFEVAGVVGFISNTTLWLGGADLHWSVLEGYRTGILGYLPDISVGGGVRTMSGQQSFYLTTVGIDGQISKPLTLADSASLTPYIGAQRLIIFANSSVVNLTPSVDPMQQCGYLGSNVPGNPNAPKPTAANPNPYDGTPVCANKLATGGPNNSDFNNNVVFQKQTFYRWRGILGLTYRYELLYLGTQFAFDLEDPSTENSNLTGGVDITGGKQWTLSFEAGVFF